MTPARAIFAAVVLGCGLAAARANTPTVTAAPTIPAAPDASGSPAGAPPAASPAPRVALLASPGLPNIDHLVVRKSLRRLYLMDGNRIVRSYKVALGLEPTGPKERDGDFRTPEGWYHLARRNPRSDYFLSIQISYPNAEDLQRARAHHWQP
ncbi:MAG: L,D-transpeptidase family protein, partial [Steroidobacteraceae bacterium]